MNFEGSRRGRQRAAISRMREGKIVAKLEVRGLDGGVAERRGITKRSPL
jgi:hypothetical protein